MMPLIEKGMDPNFFINLCKGLRFYLRFKVNSLTQFFCPTSVVKFLNHFWRKVQEILGDVDAPTHQAAALVLFRPWQGRRPHGQPPGLGGPPPGQGLPHEEGRRRALFLGDLPGFRVRYTLDGYIRLRTQFLVRGGYAPPLAQVAGRRAPRPGQDHPEVPDQRPLAGQGVQAVGSLIQKSLKNESDKKLA